MSGALLLAMGLLSAGVSVPGATLAVCFAPEEDCAAFAVRAIDAARRRILVSAYNLTTGSGIVEALLRAAGRGVAIGLIADKRTPCERNGGLEPLARAGALVWIDYSVRIAHAKTMVIDDRMTLMGSYNWTRGAARNYEDLNLVLSPAVAAAYAAQWEGRRAVSAPFRQRADWCRPRRNPLDGEP